MPGDLQTMTWTAINISMYKARVVWKHIQEAEKATSSKGDNVAKKSSTLLFHTEHGRLFCWICMSSFVLFGTLPSIHALVSTKSAYFLDS